MLEGEKVVRTKGVSGSVRVISQLVIFTLLRLWQATVEEEVDASIEKMREKDRLYRRRLAEIITSECDQH